MKHLLRLLLLFYFLFNVRNLYSQELFVYTEPASNMPAKSVGVRLSNWLMKDRISSAVNYHLIPEVMWGANKNLMIHAEGFLSNENRPFGADGGALYAKYRFFTREQMYRHFRLAAIARAAINTSVIHQEEVATNGFNSGYQLGLIATQLLHKQAISVSASFEKALDDLNNHPLLPGQRGNAIDYTLSTGRLLLPKEYTSYQQTNLNLLLELLGQSLAGTNKSYLDIAPSAQLIFNSQARVDFGYRKQLYGNMLRNSEEGFLIRLEYLFF